MFKKVENLKSKDGMALVMALLIMSLIMVSALAFSRIIFGEVRMSLNIINSVGSFYSADSGMEKTLYYLKYAHEHSDFDFFKRLEGSSTNLGTNQSFVVEMASTTYSNFLAYNITTSTPAHVDIIDLGGDVSSIDWSNNPALEHKYQIDWYIDSCFPYHASDRLEVNYESFEAGFTNPEIKKDILVCNCVYGSDQCYQPVAGYSIDNNRYYRFSFRPLHSTVSSLNFVLKEGSSDIGILSQAGITVDGNYKNSKYRLKAVLPALSPLSDIFSYVIFSEEPLIKDL